MPAKTGGYLERPAPSGLADVVAVVLDKGIVIDAYLRVALLGIEILTIDARVVVSSVDTYLRFAEATHRLDLKDGRTPTPLDIVEHGLGEIVEHVASEVVEHKVEAVKDKVEESAEKLGPLGEAVVAGTEKVVADVVEAVR
jgi:hypothetical protein